MSGLVPG